MDYTALSQIGKKLGVPRLYAQHALLLLGAGVGGYTELSLLFAKRAEGLLCTRVPVTLHRYCCCYMMLNAAAHV